MAVTNSQRTMAFPRDALAHDDALLDALAALLEEESAEGIVIGRPVALSGRETTSTAVADELYDALRARLPGVSVVQWDERLTTHEAQKYLTQAGIRARDHRARVDSAAAVIMLQNYVDALPPA